jgi:hypothetical protein
MSEDQKPQPSPLAIKRRQMKAERAARKAEMQAEREAMAPPPQPPKNAYEIEKENQLLEMMRALVPALQQRNLNNAVWLANQAARGEGPLVEHFAELGRRFHNLVEVPQTCHRQGRFNVINGGRS